MPRRIETLFLSGPAGRLEALLEEPETTAPVEAALVCHPHPQHGGTMHNKVVYRLARGLRKSGCVVLRFNYRGVNLSEGKYDFGVGETEDAQTALRELSARYPELPLLASGFSFGSRIALRLSSQEQSIERVIAAGFPTRAGEHDFVHAVHVPKHFVQSTSDQFGPESELREIFETLPEPKHLYWVKAGDHFFAGALDEYEAVIEQIGLTRDLYRSALSSRSELV
jgi:alpha/beta superfamily hydrolase